MKYFNILLILFYSCAPIKENGTSIEYNSFGEVGSVEYKISSKFYTEEISYFSIKKINRSKIKNSDWNKISKEIKALKLNTLHLLDAPTNYREVDGDWYSAITIIINKQKFQSNNYDSSNPNVKINRLDSLIKNISKKYSKTNRKKLYEAALKKRNISDQKESNNMIFPYAQVDVKPEFIGGQLKMDEFIIKQKIELEKAYGSSLVSFYISEIGKIYNIKVIRPSNEIIKNNTLKIIKSMPDWKPGEHRGEKVKVKYYLKITY